LQQQALEQIESLVPLIDWNKALRVWSLFVDFPHKVSAPNPTTSATTEQCELAQLAGELHCRASTEKSCIDDTEDVLHGENCTAEEATNLSFVKNDKVNCTDASTSDGLRLAEDDKSDICSSMEAEKNVPAATESSCLPSFRATCHRTGSHHCFQSPAAAAHFGGAVQDYFGWKVDLSNYDIEVVLWIEDRDVRVGISLTTQSLHRRHITHFGRTTLRPTIAYGMLR